VFLLGADIWAPAISFIKYEPGFIVTCLVVGAGVAVSPTINAVFIARRRAHFVLYSQLLLGLRVPLPILFASYFGMFGIFGSRAVAVVVFVRCVER
jgi:hypothetical protein